MTRPTMRFVPVKSAEQQAALALHRTRDLLVRQRTQLVNMLRGLLAEFGIEMARGLHQALRLARRLSTDEAPELPPLGRLVVRGWRIRSALFSSNARLVIIATTRRCSHTPRQGIACDVV